MKYLDSKDDELISSYIEKFNYDKTKTDEVLKKYNSNKTHVYKSRAIIIDSGKIMVCKYADVFMLPGGKKEENEDYIQALQRELREEIGILISNDIELLFEYEKTYDNYFDRKLNKRVNRHNKTNYYKIEKDNIIGYTNIQLSPFEINGKFDVFFIDINELRDLLDNYNSCNEKYELFKDELLEVLDSIEKKLIIRRKK